MYQVPQSDMEHVLAGEHEHALGDERRSSRRVVPERSVSMHARLGSQTPTGVSFARSASLNGVSDFGLWRRSSLILSRDGSRRTFEGVRSDVLAQVGDSGDRVLYNVEDGVAGDVNDGSKVGRRRSSSSSSRGSWGRGSIRLPRDLDLKYGESRSMRLEHGGVTIPENAVAPIGDALALSIVPPVTVEMGSPLPTDAVLFSTEKKISAFSLQSVHTSPFKRFKLPRSLDYIAYLIHLSVFGIFGIFARYLLQKLFGPGLLALTSDETALYIDLPANMAGSFLMGWFGLVFKGDVRHVSEHLAVGISTGFMGSLTTFSGWNQKMLELSSKDHWVFAIAGIIIGFGLVNESFLLGVTSAEWLRQRLVGKFSGGLERPTFFPDHWRVQRRSQHLTVATALLLVLGLLWGVSGALARPRLDRATEGAVLWLACLVGPPGVWLRWYLARFNGQGLGRSGSLRWLPSGTLAANILAAVVMAALSTINKAVKTKRCGVITKGVQLGFLGCLSTVSTFAAEIYAMRQSGHQGRAWAYLGLTLVPSFAIGTLIYSVPVWTRHYH